MVLYKKPQDTNIELEELCCNNKHINIVDGAKVCVNCGMIFDVNLVDDERRAYSIKEINERKQTEPRWRDFGSRTVLPATNIDFKGNILDAERRTLYTRLSKIQNSLVSSTERNYWVAKPILKELSSKLNVPIHISEIAWKIYTNAVKKRLTMGRSIEAILSASMYISIRMHEFPKLLEDISDAIMISRKTVVRSIALLLREVLPELNYAYKPITTEQLVIKFCNELGLAHETQKQALKILSESLKKGISISGKDPKGFAASAVYIATKYTGEQRKQMEIAKIAKITEVTLRTRIKEMANKKS
jgi:transcription initiation factor TFIIB